MPVFSKDTIVDNVVLGITLPYMPIDSKIAGEQNQSSKAMVIICLIIAGELIFGLPYHVLRYFRPTMLEVFDLSNTNFGDAFAIYGITALLSYFPSGVIADHFSARKLMSLSLFTRISQILVDKLMKNMEKK